MIFLIKASQLLLSLSILVVLHELGHFLPAKYFKTKVEKFYLFFDPWFSVFKKKVGDTEYGIGWLPLGGYVKIAGMIDESMDKKQMEKEPESWEFRSKPAWQRLIIMLGGVAVNFLLGIFIYSMTLYAYGDKYLPNQSLSNGVWCVDDMAYSLGFENGDKIISIDNKKPERFSSILESLLLGSEVLIDRGGSLINMSLPKDFAKQLIENQPSMMFYPRIPAIVKEVLKGSSAEKAGLLSGDKIIAVNDTETLFFDELKRSLEKYKDQNVLLTIKRQGGVESINVDVDAEGKIGYQALIPSIGQLSEMGIYKLKTAHFSFFESLPAGYKKAKNKLGSYVDQFKLILKPSTGAYKGLGGFGAIGNLFPAVWDWEIFWNLTAFLSLMLAFMNLLPIPALDGGHVVFLLYEIVVGKPAPEKVMEYAQVVGMVILLSLLVYANGNDIARLLF